MKWLDTDLGNDPEVMLAGEDEELRRNLGTILNLKQEWVNPEEREQALDAASMLLGIIHKAGGSMNMSVEFNGENHQVTQ